MTDTLFTPGRLGRIEIANRILMAPLTRNRAFDLIPNDLMVEYYRQRATAGLIVSEGTQISPTGQGYAWTPGIYSPEQVTGWKKVTAAVHDAGGKIACQLWHVGRISHPSIIDGRTPVAPSALSAHAKTFDGKGFVETSVPHALTLEEIPGVLAEYAHAAKCAIEAGFDGVEIHAANGYLIDQFLRDTSNKRTDAYGGPIAHRVRFLAEVVDTVAGTIGAERTGIRLSPWSNANNVGLDSDTPALFAAVAGALNAHNLAFVHVVEGQTGGPRDYPEAELKAFRAAIKAPYVANNGYDRDMAISAVASGDAYAVAFGRPFIANPDLPERLKTDAPLNDLRKDYFYGGGETGYTDYPFLK
ncbi:alkene reductase [Paenirhodobacter populi]|uniref:alkene reductase n=1 Tax=Paenirhodobacter populi TaxID=2306993 RepID=UPI000FE42369|nr:alkene reductase [Sinirhodobacter populi]RWR09364.1 alkene reductase [Sinirhodobacter populi]